MADIDVGVLSLAVPPQSAPKAIYCPAVRVKNYGIQARVATGYVRVYDKNTGQLVQSFDVVSQELDADQEGNAVSAASWDLTEAEVGKQYIVSGWCSCDGDMVPGNNVLDSTILTVADTPPPPPPPVEPHASQHEHGGDDQLNLDGLHGQPADPQPYADHAAKHMVDGTDQLSIEGLAGQAADPQIPSDHGNERHAVPFATSSELGNHEADTNTHSAAANLEQTANKGQVDGYAGLDEINQVPDVHLASPSPPDPGTFLGSNRVWSRVPVASHDASKHDSSVEATVNKDVASGYVGLDADGLVDPLRLAPAPSAVMFLRGDQTWQPGPDAVVPASVARSVVAVGPFAPVDVPDNRVTVVHSQVPVLSGSACRITASVDVKCFWQVSAPQIYAYCRLSIEDQNGVHSVNQALILPRVEAASLTWVPLHVEAFIVSPVLPIVSVSVSILNYSGGDLEATVKNFVVSQHVDPAV